MVEEPESSADISTSEKENTPEMVTVAVNQNIENFIWQNEKEIEKEVKSEFGKMLSNSSSSQRVKDMANKLLMANNFQTVKI
jgi:hypothetical protein